MKVTHPLFESVKKKIQQLMANRKAVKVDPKDVIEMIIKGSGPGGQAVNKTNNAVCLLHKPTGIQVRCHKTRYLEINKREAMKSLESELDKLINKDASKEAIEALRLKERKRLAIKKSKKKHDVLNDQEKSGQSDLDTTKAIK